MPTNYEVRLARLETLSRGGRLSPLLVVECRADADDEMRDRAIAAARRTRGDPEDADGLVVVISRFARSQVDSVGG